MFQNEMHWAPIGDFAQDASLEDGWGEGQQIYLTLKVKDNGIGVDVDQRLRIFERFKQANVKTHVFYGGSGFGLFVSK
jgi:signal transduction histidine kinase